VQSFPEGLEETSIERTFVTAYANYSQFRHYFRPWRASHSKAPAECALVVPKLGLPIKWFMVGISRPTTYLQPKTTANGSP
jgi:hypothetical protein